MKSSFRSLCMMLTLLAMIVGGAALPRSTEARATQKETVVHVKWSGTEKDKQVLLAALKGLDVQEYKDGARAPYAEVPVSYSWTSKQKSPAALAQWIRDQAALNMRAAGCWVIRVAISIDTPIGPITGQIIIRVCQE